MGRKLVDAKLVYGCPDWPLPGLAVVLELAELPVVVEVVCLEGDDEEVDEALGWVVVVFAPVGLVEVGAAVVADPPAEDAVVLVGPPRAPLLLGPPPGKPARLEREAELPELAVLGPGRAVGARYRGRPTGAGEDEAWGPSAGRVRTKGTVMGPRPGRDSRGDQGIRNRLDARRTR